MRKLIAAVLLGALGASMAAAPALAGRKTIHGSFDAQALPFPNYSSHTGTAKPGCTAGQEGVHWVGHEFTPPENGQLTASMEGFDGDWDLYVFQGDVALMRSDQAQVPDGAPPEEKIVLPLRKGKAVTIVACNWAGGLEATVHYQFVFKK